MLSIIIPTLNEEEHLPLLLKSIKKQHFKDYEIIVADAGSKDKTTEIAKKYNCKIVKGGLPARGRNNGAKVAKGDLFLFLDADVILPEETLAKALREFRRRKLKIATFFLLPYKKNRISEFLFIFFYNIPIFLMEKILPHAAMGILIERKLFKKLKGFDEDIKLAEDHDLARRAGKVGRYGVLREPNIRVSDRRFRKDGWLRTFSKYLLCEGHMIFWGPVKSDIFSYKFNHYSKKKK